MWAVNNEDERDSFCNKIHKFLVVFYFSSLLIFWWLIIFLWFRFSVSNLFPCNFIFISFIAILLLMPERRCLDLRGVGALFIPFINKYWWDWEEINVDFSLDIEIKSNFNKSSAQWLWRRRSYEKRDEKSQWEFIDCRRFFIIRKKIIFIDRIRNPQCFQFSI